MSLWNHLPLELYGAVFLADRYYGRQSMWRWKSGDRERHEVCTSSQWAMRAPMAMADAMAGFWRWWIVTERDDDLRADRIVPPWKLGGDIWFTVGLGSTENFVAPWPWVSMYADSFKLGGPWPWPRSDSRGS